MKATTKNSIVAFCVGIPLMVWWPINDWHYWAIAFPAWMIYSMLTRALPVYTEHRRRPPFSNPDQKS